MRLQAPTVGPLVGYTTATGTRLWLRGDYEATASGYRRAFGAVRVRGPNGEWQAPVFNKLSPTFDMTGVFVVNGLKENTLYDFEAGWFHTEAQIADVARLEQLEWTGASSGCVRTSTTDPTAKRSYVAGSCRYLLRLFGGAFFDDRGDKVFESILKQINEKGEGVDALLMVGDQIYADDLNFVAPDQRADQFFARYRAAFSQRYLAELMRQVPTYMILDDHEIEDNWPSKATQRDRITLYPHAIHAYQIYQASHAPVFSLDSYGRITGTLEHLWYTFTDGCCDWFVMDVRTERQVHRDPAMRSMISKTQMDALLQWLGNGSGRVKMVVSSVPFFPDLRAENDDKWGGFVSQRSLILDHVFSNKIPKVCFLSGDVHCSFAATLTSPKVRGQVVHSIVSSAFFWPYPHMSQSELRLPDKLTTDGQFSYAVAAASKVYSTDSFARLNVSPAGIDVRFHERKGDVLGEASLRFEGRDALPAGAGRRRPH